MWLFLFLTLCAAASQTILSEDVKRSFADIEDYPWTVSIIYFYDDNHSCGGVIITENLILTAASCIDEIPLHEFTIRAGSTNRSSGGSIIRGYSGIVHPNFRSNRRQYDIAILILGENLSFGESIQPVTLPVKGYEVLPGTIAQLIGWRLGGPPSKTLQVVRLPVMSTSVCAEKYYDFIEINSKHHCTRDVLDDISSEFDLGASLLVDDQLIGVSAYYVLYREPEPYPVIYTRIAAFRDWIDESIEQFPPWT